MKNDKKILGIIIFGIIIFVVGIPILINEAYKDDNGYLTVWGGSDVLSYYGALVGAFGTIVLGMVAWKQNERLLLLEENSYLSENAGAMVITELTVTGVKSIACNFENHVEQIIATNNVKNDLHPLEYGSLSMLCKMEPMNSMQHIAMVNVKSALIIASKDGKTKGLPISAEAIDGEYSLVAISKDYDIFQFTIIMTRDEKSGFINSINDVHSELSVDLELALLTDKYVETTLKCRAMLCNPDYNEDEGIYSHFKTIDANPPKCFWYGASVKRKEDIKVKSITEEKING